MRLQRTIASRVLVGGLLSAPVVLAGCSTSQVNSDSANAHTMPMGETPIADHAMTMDLGPKDAEFDLRFIDGMILPSGRDGPPGRSLTIAMAEAVLRNSQRAEMKQLAEAIIAAQQGEIDQMQQWRQSWYGQ